MFKVCTVVYHVLLLFLPLNSLADNVENKAIVHLRALTSSDLPSKVANEIGYFIPKVGGGFYGANFCSAALIGPNIALTAAHCIEHDFKPRFGYSATFYLPNGTSTDIIGASVLGKQTFSPKLYSKKEDLVANMHRDIAIIFLKDRVGDSVGWLSTFSSSDEYSQPLIDYRLIGYTEAGMAWAYPINKKRVISSSSCGIEFINKFEDSGKIYWMAQDKKMIVTNCGAAHGLSGGPLLAWNKSTNNIQIAGVVSSGTTETITFVTPSFQFDTLSQLLKNKLDNY